MIFSKFIKPKWQHRDPNVRLSEIENLNDPTILNQIIQNDTDIKVRQAAVKKINDLTILNQIAQNDTDNNVREIANQRFKQLLCCEKDHCPDLETRLSWVKKITDTEQIIYIAQQGTEIELRIAAIEKIEPEELLGNIAINDPNNKVRIAAVNKLTEKSILEQVIKAARNNDKRVSKKARERLDEVERPEQVRAECEEICTKLESLESLNESKFKQINTEFKRLQERWQTIVTEANTNYQTRFNQAKQAVISTIKHHQQAIEAAQKREEAMIPLREAKQGLCEKMEALLIDLKNREQIDKETEKSFQQQLEPIQSEWPYIPSLDDKNEEKRWQDRFDRAFQSVQKRHQQLQIHQELANKLDNICRKAETLLNNTKTLQPEILKDLQTHWDKISLPEKAHTLSLFSELQKRFDNNLKAIETRLQREKQERHKKTQQLKNILQELETALEAGELKTAIPLEEQARELLKSIRYGTEQNKTLEKRLQNNSAKIGELRSWQRWGNQQERENLCKQIETLLETDTESPSELIRITEEAQDTWKKLGSSGYSKALWERFHKACQAAYLRYREHLCLQMEKISEREIDDPENTAKMIRQAHNIWKELGSQGHTQALWERFNNACQAAYEPCREFFDVKAREREQNLFEKQSLCERLELFNEETNWKAPDWKNVYRFIREADKEWRKIGPTNRKVKKGLQQRFQSIMKVLETYLDEERQRNCHYRLNLMFGVDAVASKLEAFMASEHDDKKQIDKKINTAIEEIKKLQNQWQVTIPRSRRIEREFWDMFRSSCDVVFNYRKDQQEAHKKELQAYLKSKITLCEQVEALADLEGDKAIKNTPAQVKKIRLEWNTINAGWHKIAQTTQRRKAKANEAIEDRFEKACKNIEKLHQNQLVTERREQLDLLKKKAALCTQIEQKAPMSLSEIQAAWISYNKLEDAKLEAAIEQRFQQACTGKTNFIENALKIKEKLCVRMEMLAGIDSPAESLETRLAYQVERLSATFHGEKVESIEPQIEAEEIERKWYLIAVPPSVLSLEERFSKASEAFYSSYSSE
jgi:hypothetical protein